MKKLLIIVPIVMLLGASFVHTESTQPTVTHKQLKSNREEYISAPCTAAAEQRGFTAENSSAPYTHCTYCGHGVFTADENGVESCTYCGVKKN
jgi:DNA-directed RNA polymerase subunit RPC12/RpoP